MMRPATVPRYVRVAEQAMWDLFAKDLWQLPKPYRDRLLVAACDAETMGRPEYAESYIEAAVYDLWNDIKRERKRQRG